MEALGFFKYLVVLFVIKHTDEWKKKKSPSYASLHCCCFKTALLTSINFVCVKLCNLSLTLNFPKEKRIWLTRPQGFSLFLSIFQTFKKNIESTSRKAHLWVKTVPKELGRYGFSFCRNFPSKRPYLLDWFELPSIFKCCLSLEPSVSRLICQGLCGGWLLNVFAAGSSGGKIKKLKWEKKSVPKNESRKQKQTSSYYHS